MEPCGDHLNNIEFTSSYENPKVYDDAVERPSLDQPSDDLLYDPNVLIAEEEKLRDEPNEYPFDNDGYRSGCLTLNDNIEAVSPHMIDVTNEFTYEEVTFETINEADSWIRAKGKELGIAIVILKSDYAQNRNPIVKFGCERGGKKRDHQKGGVYLKKEGGKGRAAPRSSSTRKCNCPFELKCTMDRKNNLWRLIVRNGEHNHMLAIDNLGHAYNARLTQEEFDTVRSMTKNKIKPKFILKHIVDRDPSSSTISKTIYNARAKIKKEEMNGRTVIQELFKVADESNAFIRHTRSNDVIENVFWAQTDSMKLMTCFPSVLMIDCTYKTNRYKMPLLHIIGVTSTNKSFTGALALLSSENEMTFTWAMQMLREALGKSNGVPKCIVTDRDLALMNAISNVFPESKQLLCRWHIAMNVAKTIKKNVGSELHVPLINKWKQIEHARTDMEINSILDEVMNVNKEVGTYMSNWVSDFKGTFISGWIDHLFHLGNTSTSRVEGVHAILKNWLGTSNNDMVSEWKAIEAMIDFQVRDIKASFQTSLLKVPIVYLDMLWCKYLRGYVSIRALDLIKKEIGRVGVVGEDPDLCGCVLRITHGLPCAHEIAMIFKYRKTIPKNKIHIHWRTLTIEGPSSESPEAIDPQPLWCQFMAKFEMETPERQLEMVERLREVIQPRTTVLKEPPTVIKPKGRPKGAKGKAKPKGSQIDEASTKRDLSAWEHVDAAFAIEKLREDYENSKKNAKPKDSRKSKVSTKRDLSAREHVDATLSMKKLKDAKVNGTGGVYTIQARNIHCINAIPLKFHPYLKDVYDVESDGNCGFRALALGLGFGESYWPKVRRELWNELRTNMKLYRFLMKEEGRPERMLKNILWEKGCCPPNKWMDAPDTLWIVANLYNVAVTLLSNISSLTILPCKQAPPSTEPRHIWIAHVNSVHFVFCQVIDNTPLPPICAPWGECRNEDASIWEHLYKDRLKDGANLKW